MTTGKEAQKFLDAAKEAREEGECPGCAVFGVALGILRRENEDLKAQLSLYRKED